MEEFSTYLQELTVSSGELLVTGDFNIHMNKPDDPASKSLSCILDSVNLQQWVTSATHKSGNTIDLVLSRHSENIVHSVKVTDVAIMSDHATLTIRLTVDKPSPGERQISYRRLKNIDHQKFCGEMRASPLTTNPEPDVADLAAQYHRVMSELLDKHAPIITKSVTSRPSTPWYTTDIKAEKRQCQHLERTWRRTKKSTDHHCYREATHKLNQMMKQAKTEYYSSKIIEKGSDQKALFSVINTLTNKRLAPTYPSHESKSELTSRFSSYFNSKIATIRDSFPVDNSDTNPGPLNTPLCDLVSFAPTSKNEIVKMIRKSPTKSCSLDPVPTSLLKSCIEEFAPVAVNIINSSLSSGVVPSYFKVAHVTPLFKKQGLDKENMKNYRPISNLSYMSKLLEKVVVARLTEHMS